MANDQVVMMAFSYVVVAGDEAVKVLAQHILYSSSGPSAYRLK